MLLSLGWELFNSHRCSYNAYHTPCPTPSRRSSSGISTAQSHRCSAAWIGSPLFHSALLNPPSFGAPQFHSALLHPPSSALLNFIQCSLTPSLSALLSLNLMFFFFILPLSNTFCGTPLFHTTLPFWRSSVPLVVVPIFHPNVSYCLSYPHLGSQVANNSLHLCYISQMEGNDIGIPFHPLASNE